MCACVCMCVYVCVCVCVCIQYLICEAILFHLQVIISIFLIILTKYYFFFLNNCISWIYIFYIKVIHMHMSHQTFMWKSFLFLFYAITNTSNTFFFLFLLLHLSTCTHRSYILRLYHLIIYLIIAIEHRTIDYYYRLHIHIRLTILFMNRATSHNTKKKLYQSFQQKYVGSYLLQW